MKLFRIITLMLVFLTAAPITVAGFILIESSVDTLKTLTWELQQERADHAGRAVSSFFDNIIDDVDLLVSNLSVANMSVGQRQEMLSFILQKRPEVNIIAFYDAAGRRLPGLLAFDVNRILPSELADHQSQVSVLRFGQDSPESVAFSKTYTIHRTARPALSIPRRDEQAVAMAFKLNTADAAFLGMEVSLAPLQGVVKKMRVGRRGEVLLIDSQGILIAHHGTLIDRMEDPRGLSALLAQILSPQGGEAPIPRVSGARPITVGKGMDVLAAYAPLARPAWLMVSIEPLDEAYAATRTMTFQVITVVLVSLALAIGLGVLFAFGITRPIGKCVTGALAIARGKFGYTLDVSTRNEIGELAHTFNYMSRQLLDYDEENKALVASLERGYLETIRALANSIDAKDPYTRGHSMRVTNVALAIGREMGLKDEELRVLRYAGILHDIGKIGIQEGILAKKEKLSDEEREIIKQHPVLGDKIIEPIDFLQPVRPIVLHHHEWVDGSGYPDGLKADEIPLGARIVSAADTYDAVTSERPYQQAVDNQEAIRILQQLRGRQIDPEVCDALITVIERQISEGQLRPQEWEDEYTDPTWDAPPLEETK
jgi:putative nucleotidyltransferase with HDIG domain